MKHFKDGDQLCITLDDFVDLQESPVVFYPLRSGIAQTILIHGIGGLPVGDLVSIYNRLMKQERERLVSEENVPNGEES